MLDKISFNVLLEQSTVHEIDDFLGYYKKTKELTGMDLPTTHEDFIKASIFAYIERLNRFHSFVISQDTYKLKSTNTLRNKIKEYIKDEGMNQKTLSELSGVDQGSLSNILSNRNQPSMDVFLRIWIALGCPPIDELFYRDTN